MTILTVLKNQPDLGELTPGQDGRAARREPAVKKKTAGSRRAPVKQVRFRNSGAGVVIFWIADAGLADPNEQDRGIDSPGWGIARAGGRGPRRATWAETEKAPCCFEKPFQKG
jgi:hypothetical protein